ncbi:MAG: transcription antitermination factor NusB [Planctomycetota bacterium]|jgi:transcription antitermination factor NusB
MRTRTLAREAALQYLYEVDMVGVEEAESLDEFLVRQVGRVDARPHAARLVAGVLEHRAEIDAELRSAAENWTLERMAVVDRNVLRIGVYELTRDPDVPEKVAINEAIDLARRFSSEEACAFVNGVLDRIRQGDAGEQGEQGEQEEQEEQGEKEQVDE